MDTCLLAMHGHS